MKTKLMSIKNMEPYLIFNTLPTTQEQMTLFLKKMLTVSRVEAEMTIADYQGFDFDKLKATNIDNYNENKEYLQNFVHRLQAVNNIEKQLAGINYRVNTFEFSSIYNALLPHSYGIIDEYINFDFEKVLKDDPTLYDEHISYLNMHMNRVNEFLAIAKAQEAIFQTPGNVREDDLYKYTDSNHLDDTFLTQTLSKYLSSEQKENVSLTQKLRRLTTLGPIFIKCITAIENKKTVTCSENENYLVLVTPGVYFSPDVFILDEEGEAKKLNEKHYSHFDFTPLDFDDDKSLLCAQLEIKAHQDWCKSIEYKINREGENFKCQDIIFWSAGCKQPDSRIDYGVPMYITEIDDENRLVKVISNLHHVNQHTRKTEYRPLPSLSSSSFVVESIPMYRVTKDY